MKTILFAIILSRLSYCAVNDATDNNTGSYDLNWIQLPEFIDELDVFGQADLMAPLVPASTIPSQPDCYDQYSIQQCGPTVPIQGGEYSAGVTGSLYPNYESAELKPSSVVATNIVAISSTSSLTSSMLLFGDNPQSSPEMSRDNQDPIIIDQSAAKICQASAKSGNSQALPSESTPRISRNVLRLPISLLAEALNAVSQVMKRETINVKSSAVIVLQTTIERFREILEVLGRLEEYELGAKASIKASIQRIKSQRFEVNGVKGACQKALYLMTGRNSLQMTSLDCYQNLAELLVRHAILLYNKVPGVSFSEDGSLCVEGEHFPDRETTRQFYMQRNERKKKRKLTECQGEPPAKKMSPFKGTSDSARFQRNLKLLVNMHNHIAAHLNTEQIDDKQTMSFFAPYLVDSIVSLIGVALNRKEGLITADIHYKYPITMGLLSRAKLFLTSNMIPLRRQCAWFLTAFDVPNVKSTNSVDMIYHLSQWYAAVAMATIESITGIRFENEQVWVENESFRMRFQEQNVESEDCFG